MRSLAAVGVLSLFLILFPNLTISKQTLSHGLPYVPPINKSPYPPKVNHLTKSSYKSSISYHPSHYHPSPSPYHPSPSPYLPSPAPYHPSRLSYHPSPAPHHPSPAPHHPSQAPYHHNPLPYDHHQHSLEHVPYNPSPSNDEKSVPTNYDFVYSVHDDYSGDDHSHSEKKTDYMTEGQYRVRLPDGRTQVVSYTADDDGYHPTVVYEGEAHYDPPQPHLHPSLHSSSQHHEKLPEKHYKYSPTVHIPLEQLKPAPVKPNKKYKSTPTPYPAGPKVFRPKAPSYNPSPTYLPTPLPKHYKNTTPQPPSRPLYNSIQSEHDIYQPQPVHYKGKLVFLDKAGPPLLPAHSAAP